MACFGSRLRICLAIKGGEAIAALVVLRHADTLVYKYGGSDARVHNVGAMPFLFWQIIQRAGAEGVRRLDLGRSDLDNAGLITFKDRLGARRTDLAYVRYRLPSRAGREMPWAARLGKRVMATIPDRLFVSSGRLLYRHFG
jgi:lipid II:glycine glycyltransferase (peptidoglycan interpeptide bridge formation enzyme)